LFLSLSFFVILAAILLIAMLFRLGLIERTKQFGTLLAVGWPPRRTSRLALGEGMLIAALGVVVGVVLGVLYAWFVLWALRSWWVGAVTVPFLTFHWTWRSLIIGAVVGWMVAALTLVVAVRWLTRASAVSLLSGRDPDTASTRTSGKARSPKFAIGIAVVGAVVAAYGASLGGQAAAGAFVGGGTMLLVASLMLVYHRLRQRRLIGDRSSEFGFSVSALASQSASRHPLRSTMTIGLMASAAFLIIAISAFRLQPSDAGTGGFTLLGQTAQPMFRDLRDKQVQSEFLGVKSADLAETTIVPMRLRLGQDASCNNLYQATRPTVIGVPDWFGSDLRSQDLPRFEMIGGDNDQWNSLSKAATGSESDPIPMILDQNTAMWSLQMMLGVGEVKSFEYESGRPVWFQVVGLLSNSVLQGKLLIGESNFERLFTEVNGYQFFLFADQPQRSEQVTSALEDRLGDFGMDVTPTDEVLSGLMAVQNTYLRTFQSLGFLGLLLGTIGLAVSQLRSVLERRKELAVMQSMGFTRLRLASVVMRETAALLVIGVGCGALCAAVVVIPHALLSGLKLPIVEPVGFVFAIIGFGLIAGLVAVRQVIRLPLLESLRAD
jgi:ABC-type lipoprotein release transport system permease subunit